MAPAAAIISLRNCESSGGVLCGELKRLVAANVVKLEPTISPGNLNLNACSWSLFRRRKAPLPSESGMYESFEEDDIIRLELEGDDFLHWRLGEDSMSNTDSDYICAS